MTISRVTTEVEPGRSGVSCHANLEVAEVGGRVFVKWSTSWAFLQPSVYTPPSYHNNSFGALSRSHLEYGCFCKMGVLFAGVPAMSM